MPPLPALLVTKLPHVNPGTAPPVTSICVAVQSALETAKQTTNVTAVPSPCSETNLDDSKGETATAPLSTDQSTEELGTPMLTEPLMPLTICGPICGTAERIHGKTGCFTRLFRSSSRWAAVCSSPDPYRKPLADTC